MSKINERGFTLVEVVTAIGLLTMILLPILPMVPSIMKNVDKTEDVYVSGELLPRIVSDIEKYGGDLGLSESKEGQINLTGADLDVLPNYDYDVTLHVNYVSRVDMYEVKIIIYSDNREISTSYTLIKDGDML